MSEVARLKQPVRLRVVADLDDEIRRALIQHKQALESVKWAEEELLPLRQRYAAERGEFMLPSLERLRRELSA
ncbi:MAG: hypothetical protein JWR80_9516 [Bradyrhizobium sp.]|nr:hypothetical protein [Bradyrhizobium sp.]